MEDKKKETKEETQSLETSLDDTLVGITHGREGGAGGDVGIGGENTDPGNQLAAMQFGSAGPHRGAPSPEAPRH